MRRDALVRRFLLGITSTTAILPPGQSQAQGWGGRVPDRFFDDLRFVMTVSFLYFWQEQEWRWVGTAGLSANPTPMRPNDLLDAEGMQTEARTRAAAAASRSLTVAGGFAERGFQPIRFVGLPGETAYPRSDLERSQTLYVATSLRIRDATAEAGGGFAESMRLLSVADQVILFRQTPREVSHTLLPRPIVERVPTAGFQERCLLHLETVVGDSLRRFARPAKK